VPLGDFLPSPFHLYEDSSVKKMKVAYSILGLSFGIGKNPPKCRPQQYKIVGFLAEVVFGCSFQLNIFH
jgi:hypothetical protein